MAINEMERIARDVLGLPSESSFSLQTLDDAFHKAIWKESSEHSLDEIKTAYNLLKSKATTEDTLEVVEPIEVVPVEEEKKEHAPTIVNNYYNVFTSANDFFQKPSYEPTVPKKDLPPEPHEFARIAKERTDSSLPLLQRRKEYLKHHKELVQEYRARIKRERELTDWYMLPVFYFGRWLENPLYYYLTGWKKTLYVIYETIRMIACIPLIVAGIIWGIIGFLYVNFWKYVWGVVAITITFIFPIISYFLNRIGEPGWPSLYEYFITSNGWLVSLVAWVFFITAWLGKHIIIRVIMAVTFLIMRMFCYGSMDQSWLYNYMGDMFDYD